MYHKLFEKYDALIITSPSNRFYFTGFDSSFGALLLTENKKYLFTDFRYAIAAKTAVEDFEIIITDADHLFNRIAKICAEHKFSSLGYEDESVSVATHRQMKKEFGEFELKSVGSELTELRIVKTDEEIAKIRSAQAITEAAIAKALASVKSGMTERELNAEISYRFLMHGADGFAFDNIVAFGENAADCHHVPGNRKLGKGDIILLDTGAMKNGYCSDMTRTFCFGEPSSRINDLYLLVLSTQQYVLKHLKAGMTGKEADDMAREFFRANGYDKEFGHSLGHGVGIDIHELPVLASRNDLPLPENAVVTVEPGLYIEGLGGIRIEDMVVIKKDGIENLTNYAKTLII